MAKKATLSCKPCGTMVFVTDQGEAVIECYECGMELEPAKVAKKAPSFKAAVKKLLEKPATAKKLAAPKKTVAKKPAAKKAAPKKKK